MASALLDVPIVLVSLLDQNRQWFKSRVGLNARETNRDLSFCAHAVFNRESLIVPDATKDPRFAGNPLVTGAPHIRAYCGIPLFTRKHHIIGTLCVIDIRPREFTEREQRTLDDCAKVLEEIIQAQELAKITADALQYAVQQEALFRETFEHAAIGMTHTSFTGKLLRVNQRACDMLGYSADELQQISFIDITHPEDIPRNMTAFHQMMAGEIERYRMEKRFLKKDGSHLWTEISVALKRSTSGQPDYMIVAIEDIAAKKQAETDLIRIQESLRSQVTEQTARLQESNQALQIQIKKALESEREVRETGGRLHKIADNVPAMIGYWSRDLRCEFANEMYRQWFGMDPLKVIGMSMSALLGETYFEMVLPHVQLTLEGHAQSFEANVTKADGSKRTTLVRYIPEFESPGTVAGFYVLATDVTLSRSTQRSLEEANAKLTADSITDFLTGISNRRVFSERSEQACQSFLKSGEAYGLILLDLDNFKQINDVYGHGVGDEVLRITGQILKGQLRGHRDIAARLGGEEFAVLCFGDLQEDWLRIVADRLRGQICQEIINCGKKRFNFTSSFGLAISHPMDKDWKNIYARADAALYEAKATGKNRVVFGDPAMIGVTGKFRALRAIK